jgi:hypothetical protein
MLHSPRKGPWLRYQFAIVDDYSHYGTVLFHPPFRGALSEEVLTGPANFQMRPLAHQIYFSAFPIHFPNPPQHAVVRYFFFTAGAFFLVAAETAEHFPSWQPCLSLPRSVSKQVPYSGAQGVEFHGIGSSFPHLIVQPSLSLPR